MARRCQDYLRFGVPNVWIVDPETRAAWYLTADGLVPAESGELTVPGTPIRIVLDEVFAELDAV